MAIKITFGNTSDPLSGYRDLVKVVAALPRKGQAFYVDKTGAPSQAFYVTFISFDEHYVLAWFGQPITAPPSTFTTDFPNATQLEVDGQLEGANISV